MKEKIKPSVQTKPQEEKSSKIPWLFGWEVKDLVQPITIRRVRLMQLGVIALALVGGAYLLWDNFLRAPSGTEMVAEMVEAAGGEEAWNNIGSGHFTRTKNLYSEAGDLLTNRSETFYFKKIDAGVQLMVQSKDKDGKDVWVGQDDDGFWATKADLPSDPKRTAKDLGMMCDSKFCQPTCASSMAFYRFSMPFKLKDYGVISHVGDGTKFAMLDWNPLEHLKIEPLVLDVSYEPEVGKDKWRFFVQPEDKLIHKLEYYNKSDFGTIRPEEVYWSDHKTVSGITFSHKWTRYWANGQVMEETIYSDVDFENALAEDFFDRPEGLNWLSAN